MYLGVAALGARRANDGCRCALAAVIPGASEGAVPRWRAQRDRNVLPRQRAAGGLEEGVLEARELYSLPVLICGVAAIIFAAWLARDVLSRDSGTPAMQDIANRIYIGAVAFLRRQYSTIAILAVFVAIIIGFVVGFFEHEYQTTRGIITCARFPLWRPPLWHLGLHRYVHRGTVEQPHRLGRPPQSG